MSVHVWITYCIALFIMLALFMPKYYKYDMCISNTCDKESIYSLHLNTSKYIIVIQMHRKVYKFYKPKGLRL